MACPFCYVMIDDGVKAQGVEDDDIRVGDLAMHVLEAIENAEPLVNSEPEYSVERFAMNGAPVITAEPMILSSPSRAVTVTSVVHSEAELKPNTFTASVPAVPI